MTEFKEKGHDINVTNIVVHKINKNGGQKATALKLRDDELKIGQQEIYFVADTRKSFQKRSKPTYGIFDTTDSYNDFHVQLKKSAPATGAFVVFANYVYKDNNDRYLLIFSINNNNGYNLNEEELTIQQILNLDLSKLDVAALVNITKWQKYQAGDDEGIKTYLSFIKGKKKLSDYFLDFIGCADKSTNTDSSKLLVSALNKYLEDSGYPKDVVKAKKKAVYDYCQTCILEKKEVLLDQISYLVNDEDPDGFATFASSEDYGVGEIVKPDNAILRSLQYIDYRSTDLTISFSKTKLNKKEIIYNSQSKTLTIKALPQDLINQLEQNG
jgi:nucleoid-associated protein